MGSCILVALIRDEDVYIMNLDDCRATVAQYREKAGEAELFGCEKKGSWG